MALEARSNNSPLAERNKCQEALQCWVGTIMENKFIKPHQYIQSLLQIQNLIQNKLTL